MQGKDDFTDYYSELLEGDYDCVDRIVINAYYPMGWARLQEVFEPGGGPWMGRMSAWTILI